MPLCPTKLPTPAPCMQHQLPSPPAMVKQCSLAAALAAATLALAAAPANAWFVNPFKCGREADKPCCVTIKKSATPSCSEGLVCKAALCRKCGIEGAPLCDGAPPGPLLPPESPDTFPT